MLDGSALIEIALPGILHCVHLKIRSLGRSHQTASEMHTKAHARGCLSACAHISAIHCLDLAAIRYRPVRWSTNHASDGWERYPHSSNLIHYDRDSRPQNNSKKNTCTRYSRRACPVKGKVTQKPATRYPLVLLELRCAIPGFQARCVNCTRAELKTHSIPRAHLSTQYREFLQVRVPFRPEMYRKKKRPLAGPSSISI